MAGPVDIDPAKPQAFLSYTRADDNFLGGAISRLRKDIEAAVPFVSGQSFKIFQDKDGIGFGQDWLDRLEEALRQARFLIPILTPSYFRSEPCRAEAFRFLHYEAAAGRNDLILPIYLQDTPLVENAEQRADDELAIRLAERQFRNWRQLIHAVPESAERRAAIIDLAREISQAASRSIEPPAPPSPKPDPRADIEDRLGVLEAKLDERDRAIVAERSKTEQLENELADEKAKTQELAEAPSAFEGQVEEARKRETVLRRENESLKAKRKQAERHAPGTPRSFYLGGAALALLVGAGGGWMAGQGDKPSSDMEQLRQQNLELTSQLERQTADLDEAQTAMAELKPLSSDVEQLRQQNGELIEQLDARTADLDEAQTAMADLQTSAAEAQANDDKVAELTEHVEALSEQLAASEQAAAAKENELQKSRQTAEQAQSASNEQKTSKSEPTNEPLSTFKDCAVCPQMVVIPVGAFFMGSRESEPGSEARERPRHRVHLQSFAIGKYEVTFAEWEVCVDAGGCDHQPYDHGWGRGARPVINVSWEDAQQYVAWLSDETGETYRLPSEAEWEYAARAFPTSKGSNPPAFAIGDTITKEQANFGNHIGKTVEVGNYPANDWDLHDMHGNVFEWVEDSWHETYNSAPTDGRSWVERINSPNVIRGGAWSDEPRRLRSAYRGRFEPIDRIYILGFRVARTLTP